MIYCQGKNQVLLCVSSHQRIQGRSVLKSHLRLPPSSLCTIICCHVFPVFSSSSGAFIYFLCSLIFSQFLLSSSVLSYLFLFTLHNMSSRAPDHCPPLCAHPQLPFFLLSALAVCPSLLPLFFVVSGSRALLMLLLMSHMLSLADDPSTLPV